MRFDELIRSGVIVRDVKRQYPETAAIFEEHGVRAPCDDCSIEEISRKHELRSADLIDEFNRSLARRAQ